MTTFGPPPGKPGKPRKGGGLVLPQGERETPGAAPRGQAAHGGKRKAASSLQSQNASFKASKTGELADARDAIRAKARLEEELARKEEELAHQVEMRKHDAKLFHSTMARSEETISHLKKDMKLHTSVLHEKFASKATEVKHLQRMVALYNNGRKTKF